VVAVDSVKVEPDLGRVSSLQLELRHGVVGRLIRSVGIDTVIHTASVVDTDGGYNAAAHDSNLMGAINLLAACSGADSPVRRLVLKSSTHVYGSRHDLPTYVREDRQVDDRSPHRAVRDMIEVERLFFDFAQRQAGIEVVVLRFANTLHVTDPGPLARHLDLALVPLPIGYEPMIQLIQADDCVDALAAASRRGRGIYNIAAPRPLPLYELLKIGGKQGFPILPPAGPTLALTVLAGVGIKTLTPQLYDLLRWGRTVSTGQARRGMGFGAQRDTAGALESYLSQRRAQRLAPKSDLADSERQLRAFFQARAQAAGEDRESIGRGGISTEG
jgi:UDP-glucose 4-epimerase